MWVAAAAFGIRLPAVPLAVVLVVEGAVNVGFHLFLRRAIRTTPALVATAIAVDLLILTALLHFTGGPMNPFNFLYLVHLALAAALLPVGATTLLTVCAAGLFALLFVSHVPLEFAGQELAHTHHAHGHGASGLGEDPAMLLHTRGMWVAFVVASGFIVFFTARIRRAMDVQASELRSLEVRAQHAERLGGLATLAAGAAHELATPLSTIAVAARELEISMGSGDLRHEAEVIRREVERCRDILGRLGADAGRPRGERLATVTVEDLLRRVQSAGPNQKVVRIDVAPEVAQLRLQVQLGPLVRAIGGLVDNAVLASPAAVRIVAARNGDRVVIAVEDQGPGIDADTLAKVGEPFFTTRAGPEGVDEGARPGMGLGVFVARNTVSEHGGALRLESSPGRGTRAVVELPMVVLPPPTGG